MLVSKSELELTTYRKTDWDEIYFSRMIIINQIWSTVDYKHLEYMITQLEGTRE